MTTLESIQYGFRSSQKLLNMLLHDLKAEDAQRQPCDGGNCIAWVLGHLIVVDVRTLTLIGAEVPTLPDGFETLFTTTRQAATTQTGLPELQQLIKLFNEIRDMLVMQIPKISITELADPAPIDRPLFKTFGEFLFFMSLHTAMHTGQISLTRRAFGYPPLV